MNSNSLLCRYLSEHPEWETSLKDDFNLKIRREGPYAIFNYGYEARFSDPLVQEARGIILDTECLEVVCWPFRKFGNFNEEYAYVIVADNFNLALERYKKDKERSTEVLDYEVYDAHVA